MNGSIRDQWQQLDARIYPLLADQYVNSKFPEGSRQREEIEKIRSMLGKEIISGLFDYKEGEKQPLMPATLVVGDSQFLSGILAVNEVLARTENTIRQIIIYGDKFNAKVNPYMIQEARKIDSTVTDLQQSHAVLIQKCIDDLGIKNVSVHVVDFLSEDTIENTGVISAVREIDPHSTHFQILAKSFHAHRQLLLLRRRYPNLSFEMLPYEIPGANLELMSFDGLDKNVQLLLSGEYSGVVKLKKGSYE